MHTFISHLKILWPSFSIHLERSFILLQTKYSTYEIFSGLLFPKIDPTHV